MARRSPGAGAHVHPDRLVRARERLRLEIEGFYALQAAAVGYGERMASLGRYREGLKQGKLDKRRLAQGHADELMRRTGAEARLRAAREAALDAGLGPAQIEEMVTGRRAA
jgi:hypothetical protein